MCSLTTFLDGFFVLTTDSSSGRLARYPPRRHGSPSWSKSYVPAWGAPRHEDHGVSAHALHQCLARHGLASVAIGRHWDHPEAPNSQVWRWGGLGGAMEGTRRVHVGVLTIVHATMMVTSTTFDPGIFEEQTLYVG